MGEGWSGGALRQVARPCSALWATPLCLLFALVPAATQEAPDRFRTLLDSVEMAVQLLRAPAANFTIEGVEIENAFYEYGHGLSGQGPDQILYHSGGNPGVVAYMIVAPYRGIALFLAANSDRGAGVLISVLELWADFHRIGLPPLY